MDRPHDNAYRLERPERHHHTADRRLESRVRECLQWRHGVPLSPGWQHRRCWRPGSRIFWRARRSLRRWKHRKVHSPITTAVGIVQGQTTTGDLWLDNAGALVIAALDASRPAVQSGGIVDVLAHSAVEVTQDVKSSSSISITSTADASGGDLVVAASVSIVSATAWWDSSRVETSLRVPAAS